MDVDDDGDGDDNDEEIRFRMKMVMMIMKMMVFYHHLSNILIVLIFYLSFLITAIIYSTKMQYPSK